ncbi:maleylpyruvate isomerase family mycothiol-dependent enzyme [Actinoallomurus rhizosphaericola]|uniref:maleylpyruvate isomerase family mycothiol-dependent enzyme n=1 Tax=Actinoallomurus rhizosphaericola TaxID=2952536 RepID=UPI0020908CDF|nr:maleylpyruvate isomerase family mycothiol-dependent enzyme [Actinoallomurus rhizosphaericola]MCO5994517.1 maleylpyruvate isomerase family mycothiol-dependent enzyme [Actinoallomurus rhizosphaericola]
MAHRTYEEYCAAVEAEVARFVAIVGEADPAASVPTCPGWTIADLTRHHGTTYRWMTHLVRTRATERVWSRDVPLDLPEDVRAYPAWVAESAAILLETLRATDPDRPNWTIGADRHVRFFPRRVLFEAVVHTADAEIAVGRQPRVDAATAADGIEELLENLPAFGWVADRVRELDRDGETLHLHATDGDGEWMIRPGDGGFTWERGHGKGTTAVRAATGDLLLLVYGRLRPDDERLEVFGDRDLLSAWLAATGL